VQIKWLDASSDLLFSQWLKWYPTRAKTCWGSRPRDLSWMMTLDAICKQKHHTCLGSGGKNVPRNINYEQEDHLLCKSQQTSQPHWTRFWEWGAKIGRASVQSCSTYSRHDFLGSIQPSFIRFSGLYCGVSWMLTAWRIGRKLCVTVSTCKSGCDKDTPKLGLHFTFESRQIFILIKKRESNLTNF
jgi:hypothetical protein